jgi:uncharacterized damage-inducible protein DinB
MLQNLINYTFLADRKIIDAFMEAGKSIPEAEKLFSHVLNAQHIWAKRIIREKAEYDIFQIHSIGVFENIHLRNSEYLLQILRIQDPEELIIYTNSKGESFVNTVYDILFHVVNHSTYHRAQVASHFRQNGVTPPSTDYIMFKRDGLL